MDTQGIRGVVFTLAVTSTIGFWAIFSRLDNAQFSGSEASAQTSNELPYVQEESQIMANLPPIPTLVPIFDGSPAAPSPVLAGSPAPQLAANPAVATPPAAISSPRDNSAPAGKSGLPKQKKSGGKTTSTRSSK
jgi:hypothetical protein